MSRIDTASLPICQCGHIVGDHTDGQGPCGRCDCERYAHMTAAHLPRPTVPATVSGVGSSPEEALALQLKGSRIVPAPLREYKFHPARQWRVDFAWPALEGNLADWLDGGMAFESLALEIEGMDHRKTQRYRTDLAKYNALALLGWTLIRFTPAEIKAGKALDWLEAIFSGTDLVELTEFRTPFTRNAR